MVYSIHILFHLVGLLWETTRATRRGGTIKEATCEQCGYEYVCLLQRTSQGEVTRFLHRDYETAEVEAENNLARMLAKAIDPVPCPACGWYQRPMIRCAKKLKYRGLFKVSLYLLPIGVIVGFIGMVVAGIYGLDRDAQLTPETLFVLLPAILGVLCVVLALVLPVVKVILSWIYDPNADDSDVRMELGRSRAIGKKEYLSGHSVPGA
jgi:hypothetical protein